MSFEIIDYSRLYYELITATPVTSKRSGKFVIIENCDTGREYLALSATELSVYHANIVERFCVQRQIKGSYNDKKDHFIIHDDAWSVNGGGMWSLDDDEKSFRLFGSSKALWRVSYEKPEGQNSLDRRDGWICGVCEWSVNYTS